MYQTETEFAGWFNDEKGEACARFRTIAEDIDNLNGCKETTADFSPDELLAVAKKLDILEELSECFDEAAYDSNAPEGFAAKYDETVEQREQDSAVLSYSAFD